MNEWRMEGKKITDCGMGISDCGKDMRVYKNRNHYFKNFRGNSYQLLVISSQLRWPPLHWRGGLFI